MLAAGASERNHQVLEPALLIAGHASVDERHHAGQELVHAFLLIEVFDHRRVASGESLETIFAARVRKAATVENKAAAVSSFIFRQAAVKREAEDANDQVIRVRSQALQFLRRQHAVKGVQQRGQSNWQLNVVQQPAQVLQRVGHALEEMHFAFVESAESVGAQSLHDADVDVGIVILQEHV